MHRFYMIIATLVLSGCVYFPSRVVRSGPNGVAIEPVMIFPDIKEIQKLADSECAKYGRIAQAQEGRSSRDRYPGSILSLGGMGVVPNGIESPRSTMRLTPIYGFRCVEPPKPPPDLPLEWPQLQ
jgi:hypothetical protein